jgi:hypothetical protein
MEDDDDDDATYTKRRSTTTLPKSGLPFNRRNHDVGLNYIEATKKPRRLSNSEKHTQQKLLLLHVYLFFCISSMVEEEVRVEAVCVELPFVGR